MSSKLINHSPDLCRLRDEGYEIEIKDAFLLVHSVPYVNSKKEVLYGTLVCPLTLSSAYLTAKPENHVAFFDGEHPCDYHGNEIKYLVNGNQEQTMGITVKYSFSSAPEVPFEDYYQKVKSYVRILSHQAIALDPNATAQTFKVVESTDPDVVFKYPDTNSSRARINSVSSKLAHLKIGIVGLGGTGSYILDFVAKTSVREIHLFDEDKFLLHNAYRAPGALFEYLGEQPTKVSCLNEVYSTVRRGIVPHEYHIATSNLNELHALDFVFLCIDDSEIKKTIVDELLEQKKSFIDVGIGIEMIDGSLTGSARVTTCTPEKQSHLSSRMSFTNDENMNYSQNIQIAELNALNAALAVIKWKKLYGFYHDDEKEYNSSYNININHISNNEALT